MRPRITFANVVSVIALFVALGGTAIATHPGGQNTISTADIQNGEVKVADIGQAAVMTDEIASNQVKVADIGDGEVRTAELANGQVKTADIGTGEVRGSDVADDNLTGADIDEATLSGFGGGGSTCPSGMTRFGNTVCIDTSPRGTGTWFVAADTCAAANLRLPSVSETRMAEIAGVIGSPGTWTDVAYREEPSASAALTVAIAVQPDLTRVHGVEAGIDIRCATTPE